jgi:hypothetical protein
MKVPHRLIDFSVVVWIKKNENFGAVRSEVLAAAGAEPYETRRSIRARITALEAL